MTYYRRRTLEAWEEAAALAVGAAVGLGAAYLARIWLRRAPADRRDRGPEDRPEESERDRPERARRDRSTGPHPTEGGTGRPR